MEKINKKVALEFTLDVIIALLAGVVVSVGFYFFQNSNGFAPGGISGLATMLYYLLNYEVSWGVIMIIFNLPIFVLVTIFVNKKLGIILMIYLLTQSLCTQLWEEIGAPAYCEATNGEDYEIVFACIATGVISGLGFSTMIRRFGASGGTYAISALIKKFKPETNIAYLAFLMDTVVVACSFFVYGFNVTPTICTLINLFIANVVVDGMLTGMKVGYKFEIITNDAEELAQELMDKLHHGVTEMRVEGKYSHTEKSMIICIIRKKQVGEMMKIIKKYPGTFANYSKVNEVFGKFGK